MRPAQLPEGKIHEIEVQIICLLAAATRKVLCRAEMKVNQIGKAWLMEVEI